MIDSISNQCDAALKLFDQKCVQAGKFLDNNPSVYKTVMVANHLFRAVSMFTLMEALPLPAAASLGLMLVPSVLYRASVERFCVFRFTMASIAGAGAFSAGKDLAISLLSRGIFSSLATCLLNCARALYAAGYVVFICDLVDKDVEKRMHDIRKKQCCH